MMCAYSLHIHIVHATRRARHHGVTSSNEHFNSIGDFFLFLLVLLCFEIDVSFCFFSLLFSTKKMPPIKGNLAVGPTQKRYINFLRQPQELTFSCEH